MWSSFLATGRQMMSQTSLQLPHHQALQCLLSLLIQLFHLPSKELLHRL
jgi:hypothetical protein